MNKLRFEIAKDVMGNQISIGPIEHDSIVFEKGMAGEVINYDSRWLRVLVKFDDEWGIDYEVLLPVSNVILMGESDLSTEALSATLYQGLDRILGTLENYPLHGDGGLHSIRDAFRVLKPFIRLLQDVCAAQIKDPKFEVLYTQEVRDLIQDLIVQANKHKDSY